MRVRVQFFSQLREIVGSSEVALDLPAGVTVADLLAKLFQLYPSLHEWERNLLIGAGVEFVGRDYVIQPNDDIAVMPPVQGG
jgi:molybdopterin converting factor small subunit